MSCAHYADAILEFVKLYGGGPGAPFILFMDGIGKKYNSSMILGKDFWHALTYTKFQDKTCMFPMLRVSLALVNLTTTKVQDGIARFIGKADVARVGNANNTEKALAYEATLKSSFDIVQTLGLCNDDVLKELGYIFVRVGLLATKKGKDGPEEREYTLPEIQFMFLADMEKRMGRKVIYDAWTVTAPEKDKDKDAKENKAPANTIASVQNLDSATWLAKQKGFSVGCYVHEKVPGKTPNYKITKINDATGQVEMHVPAFYPGEKPPVSGTVTLQVLLENWGPVKWKEPSHHSTGQVRPNSLQISSDCAQIFLALLAADTAHQMMKESLVMWRTPDLVMTGDVGLQKGKLVLVPVVALTSISDKKPIHDCSAVRFTLKSGATYYSTAPVCSKDTELDKQIVSAYFWVQRTHKIDEANMEEGHITTNGIQIPVLKNSVHLKPHTRLWQYVPESEKVRCSSFVANAIPEPKDEPKAKRPKQGP